MPKLSFAILPVDRAVVAAATATNVDGAIALTGAGTVELENAVVSGVDVTTVGGAITFDGDDGSLWAAGVIAQTTGGTFEFLDIPLDPNGAGTLTLPADWPQANAVGLGMRCTHYTPRVDIFDHNWNLQRARLSDRLLAAVADPDRCPSHKWRGVRTAPLTGHSNEAGDR